MIWTLRMCSPHPEVEHYVTKLWKHRTDTTSVPRLHNFPICRSRIQVSDLVLPSDLFLAPCQCAVHHHQVRASLQQNARSLNILFLVALAGTPKAKVTGVWNSSLCWWCFAMLCSSIAEEIEVTTKKNTLRLFFKRDKLRSHRDPTTRTDTHIFRRICRWFRVSYPRWGYWSTNILSLH